MRVDDMFPSKYMKANDLNGRELKVKIASVGMEEISSNESTDTRPVLEFEGDYAKALILNKTNAGQIGVIHGEDADAWAGKEITLYPTTTQFRGKVTPCVRVREQVLPAVKGEEPSW